MRSRYGMWTATRWFDPDDQNGGPTRGQGVSELPYEAQRVSLFSIKVRPERRMGSVHDKTEMHPILIVSPIRQVRSRETECSERAATRWQEGTLPAADLWRVVQ